MKKLMMFAAAMTIVGGAYAACTLPTASNECALVYSVKVSAKTTVSKTKVDCDEICYRSKGSISLSGYLYVCSCACEDFMSSSLLWLEDKKGDEVYEGPMAWAFLNRIGKNTDDAEAFWLAGLESDAQSEITLYGAGFGKFDSKAGFLKSMSGNVVGLKSAPLCATACEITGIAVAFPACDFEADPTVPTVVFGTFSLNYNKKLSEKYYTGLWAPGL